jgi:hypothetical protein
MANHQTIRLANLSGADLTSTTTRARNERAVRGRPSSGRLVRFAVGKQNCSSSTQHPPSPPCIRCGLGD